MGSVQRSLLTASLVMLAGCVWYVQRLHARARGNGGGALLVHEAEGVGVDVDHAGHVGLTHLDHSGKRGALDRTNPKAHDVYWGGADASRNAKKASPPPGHGAVPAAAAAGPPAAQAAPNVDRAGTALAPAMRGGVLAACMHRRGVRCLLPDSARAWLRRAASHVCRTGRADGDRPHVSDPPVPLHAHRQARARS